MTELAVGEALVSFLDEKGQPNVVDRALIYPPQSQLPPLTPAERESIIKQSSIFGHDEKVVDRNLPLKCSKRERPSSAAGGKVWKLVAG